MTTERNDVFLKDLKEFLHDYADFTRSNTIKLVTRLESLQRRIALISKIIVCVHGGGYIRTEDAGYDFQEALRHTLNGITFRDANVVQTHIKLTLNEAIGNIENNTLPDEEIRPILPIKDDELRKRCLHLLDDAHPLDTVIREATVILEDRLRGKLSAERLAEIIPKASEHMGEPLITKLLSADDAKVVISGKKAERVAFYKMMVGIVAYLRNPFHHSLNDTTELTYAWSVVGLIDSMLAEIDQAYVPSEASASAETPKKI